MTERDPVRPGYEFSGFPAVGKATAIPNLFFAVVAPRLRAPGDFLAFLWTSKLIQAQKGEIRFTTADDIWAESGAGEAFEVYGGGRTGLKDGLLHCVEAGALLGLDVANSDGQEQLFFINNPGSRRAIARVRAGELVLRPNSAIRPLAIQDRPDIFRLYEENIGTVAPMVGERLLAAVDEYHWDWIVDAFREAVELNRRNWRYVESKLLKWAQEGRHERTSPTPFESQRTHAGPRRGPARYG